MTTYRERLLAGHYDPVPSSPDETTLAELKQQAEAAGLPTYGTKADLLERIQSAKTQPDAAADEDA